MKEFKCPYCGETANAKQWNRCTRDELVNRFGYTEERAADRMISINNNHRRAALWFTCPACGKLADGKFITHVKIE